MYKNILVPVDLNEESFADKALEQAQALAATMGAEIHLLNVLPGIHMSMVASYFPQEAAQQMKADVKIQLEKFAAKYITENVNYHLHIEEGKPYTTILKQSAKINADLIIIPSHKRSRLDKVMLGSVAAKVVENSPINVMVIKPQG
ncbi:universal stress protein [Vibrio sp. SS-MA-C1-2]|uniref:universal stress protein n=1 Tax=Vibrio sp. SS-MA-C1-2 TaxID=2908646 RepID=UPI001F1F4636|nr:universal stress protein [Vibrio sp. SS-MA-C1-2]UJF19562.1 universal stress protein [Vibrio sp. SS-MA-C1-2]